MRPAAALDTDHPDGAAAEVLRVDLAGHARLLDDAAGALRDLAQAPAEIIGAELSVGLLDRLYALAGPLAAAQARLLHAASVADVPRTSGAANVASWLRTRYGLNGGQASVDADRARLLRFLPSTAERLVTGEVSARQADTIVAAVKSKRFTPDEAERDLLPLADGVDDTTFRARVRTAEARKDADDIARDQRVAFQRRGLKLTRHRDGMLGISGKLHPTAGALIEAGLASTMTADPADTPDESRRTADQRRADALVDLVDAALRHGAPPSSGGITPQVHVHVDYDDVADRAGRNPLDDPDDPDHPGRTGRQQHPDGTWRTSGGELDGYGPLGPEAMARLLCEATISRIVRRGPSQVLDVGRATATWPTATRRAIVARDRHCRFPGCDRPAAWCQAHHVVFRSNDGHTNVPNGVLLCSYHHHLVHEGGWTLTFDPATGEVTVVNPDATVTFVSRTDHDPRGPAPPPGRRRRPPGPG